jgi:hypothetical protein
MKLARMPPHKAKELKKGVAHLVILVIEALTRISP